MPRLPLLPRFRAACLTVVVAVLAGCGRSASPPDSTGAQKPRSTAGRDVGARAVEPSAEESQATTSSHDLASDETPAADTSTDEAMAASAHDTTEKPGAAAALGLWETLPPEARERLVLLTPLGPAIADVWITIDSRPYTSARDAYLCRLLEVSSPAEASRMAWSEALASGRFAGMVGGAMPTSLRDAEQTINQYDRDRDGRVDWDEAGRYVDRVAGAGGLFELEARAADLGSGVSAWRGGLFSQLDRDGDGRLSPSELQSAPEQLASLDVNGDGLIAAEETSARGTMSGGGSMSMTSRNEGPPLAERLGPAARWDSLYVGLGEMYGGIDTSSAAERPLVASLLERLDVDRNGMMSRRELDGMETTAPDLRCVVRFGDAGDEPGSRVEPNRELAVWQDAKVRSSNDDRVHSIVLAGLELRIRSVDQSEFAGDPFARDDKAARSRFEAADSNDDGLLSAEEFPDRQGGGYGSFELVDADHDGDVDLEEMVAFARLRDVPRRTAIRASVDLDLDSLFARLDASGDRRLSAREIRAAMSLMALDQDGDGSVGFAEVPSLLNLQIGRSPGGATPAKADASASEDLASVPNWFRRMDANGDGDVAKIEFLGAPEQFSAVDLNGDGFLDADEAKATDVDSEGDADDASQGEPAPPEAQEAAGPDDLLLPGDPVLTENPGAQSERDRRTEEVNE